MKAKAVGSLAALAAAASLAAWYAALPIASAEYPGLLDAYDRAPAETKAAMRDVVQAAATRYSMVTFTRATRDSFLGAGGYCTALARPGCRPVPAGTEAEGLAIERFGHVARWGTPYAPEEPCHPRRCVPGASAIIAAPVPPNPN